MKHTNALKELAQKQGKPANFIVFNPINITYFTNFSEATALYIPEDGKPTLYVSSVNCQHAKDEIVKGFTVEELKRGEKLMEKIVKDASAKKFSIDSLAIESWRSLVKAVGGEENLEVASNLIRELRNTKNAQEIQLIREACKMADIGAKTASEVIKAGVTEKQVATEVEYAMRKAGSDGAAFDTIIASGYCCTYPHGSCMNRTIRDGDFVVADLGAIYKFYRSDITRTYMVGQLSDKQKRLYELVKSAYQKAFETIKPGVAASEVDKAARSTIEQAGFGQFFVHNLGHGVGLEVHEGPVLSPDSKDILEADNVVTVEPGIYLPGFTGCRIEDTVLVTKDGAEKLTTSPYLM